MKSFRRLFRYQRAGYLFVLPGFLYMLVFVGWPMLYNVILSLQDVTQKNLINGERQFVALANYADLFADSVFRRSIGNTLLYTVLCLVLQFAVGFLLALFFSRNFSFDGETLRIEPWGENAFRVRAWKQPQMPPEDWALTRPHAADFVSEQQPGGVCLTNGGLTVFLSAGGKLTFYNVKGEKLLEEYHRNRRDLRDPKCSAIEVEGREFKPIPGGDYHLTARFESLDPNEKLYGMGQYQHGCLELKGMDLELAQRNSQASVPFLVSSRGYGLL